MTHKGLLHVACNSTHGEVTQYYYLRHLGKYPYILNLSEEPGKYYIEEIVVETNTL